jgi:small neutral amino acid transporter SnatA (MarC family)
MMKYLGRQNFDSINRIFGLISGSMSFHLMLFPMAGT